MKFLTQSGSVYEIDQVNNKIRRLTGSVDPTPRQGTDGEWRFFVNMHLLKDERIFVDYDGEGHGTLTSPIVKFFSEEAT